MTPLQKFEADLREAARRMDSDGRFGVGLAVRAALEFVYANPNLCEAGLSRPYFTLLAALDDLSQGRVAEILRPVEYGNRPPDGAVREEAKAHACFSVEALIVRGVSVEDACKAVSKVCERHGLRSNSQKQTAVWKVVRGWRERLSKLDGDHHLQIVLRALRQGTEGRNEFATMGEAEILDLLDRNLKAFRSQIWE